MRTFVVIAFLAAAAAGVAVLFFPERTASVLPASVASVLGLEAGGNGDDAGGRPPTAVGTAPVAVAPAVSRFETSGEVVAADSVVLSAEVAGMVETVFVEDGARLEKGDPVVRFDDTSEREAVEAARARLVEAQADLYRQRELFERDVAAEARVETARAAAEAARADLEAAQARLEDETVRAPFSGRVGFVDVSPGAFLRPGDPIATLKTVEALRARFSLPLEVARAARDAERVRLAWDDTAVEAPVVVVSPLNDPDSRTRPAEAELPPGTGLEPGAFVTVSVPTARRENALLVPQTAVRREGFRSHVFRVVEGEDGPVARRTTVETGVLAGACVEIRSGLTREATVVSSGLQKIRDGARVRPAGSGASRQGGRPGQAASGGASPCGEGREAGRTMAARAGSAKGAPAGDTER